MFRVDPLENTIKQVIVRGTTLYRFQLLIDFRKFKKCYIYFFFLYDVRYALQPVDQEIGNFDEKA